MYLNTFTIIAAGLLYVLTGICFFLPFRAGHRTTAWLTLWTLLLLTSVTVFGDLDFLVIFLWPFIFAFQIVFISYWTFKLFKRPKLAPFFATVLVCIFAYVALSPWIDDWRFSKNDARKILLTHQINLKDDFEITANEAGGFRDYYHTFRLKLSGADYDRVAKTFRSSANFSGLHGDTSSPQTADYSKFDTVDFETPFHIEREYWARTKLEDGTYHFRFQLGKADSVLNYIGSNE